MTTLTIRSEVGDDGKLRLEVPCRLPPGPVEVVLVVQPTSEGRASDSPARSGLFLGRAPAGLDIDAIAGELNTQWKAKLANL